jgi:hypothetical protein
MIHSDKHEAAGHDDCRRNPVKQTTGHVVFSSTAPGGREIISFVAQNGVRRIRREWGPPNWLLFHNPETFANVGLSPNRLKTSRYPAASSPDWACLQSQLYSQHLRGPSGWLTKTLKFGSRVNGLLSTIAAADPPCEPSARRTDLPGCRTRP